VKRELVERTIGKGRSVTVNLGESPLSWLQSRGHVDARQFEAGERLRADYETAQLGARVTMAWDAAPAGRTPRGTPPALDPALATSRPSGGSTRRWRASGRG
jgi:hypothetical protein